MMAPLRSNLAALFTMSCLIALPALAHDVASGALRLSEARISLPPPGARTAAGYISITNTGHTADSLVAGSSVMAAATEIHLTSTVANITRMRQIKDGVPLAAGQTVSLRPAGYHFMFVGLKRPLRAGDHVSVRLRFAHAPSVQIDFVVEKYLGQPAAASSMDMHGRPM